MFCDERIVRQLIEIEAGLLGLQRVDLQFQSGDLDLDLTRRFAAQGAARQFHSFRAPYRCIVALDNL